MLEVDNRRSLTAGAKPASAAESAVTERAPQHAPVKMLYLTTDTFERRNSPPEGPPEPPKNYISNFDSDSEEARTLCNQLHKTMPGAFEKYFSGDMDEQTLLRTVDRAVSSLLNVYEGMGFDPKEIAADVIQDAYDLFRSEVVRGAFIASWQEGRIIGRQLSCKGSYIYYNSDYYYQSEELIDHLYAHMQDLAEQAGHGPADFPRDYPKGDLRNQFYGSYNTYVSADARELCGSLIDESMVPPRDFQLFYDANGRGTNRYPASMGVGDSGVSLFDGAVYIQYQGWSFSHRVPVRMNPLEYPVYVHLMDVVKSSGKGYPKEIEGFLNNFDFFATNVGNLYEAAHPRKPYF